MLYFWQVIWLLIPGAFANSAPVLVKNYFKFLAKPVDGGVQFMGKPLLGSHKTWRGFILGSLFGVIIGVIQEFLYFRFEVLQQFSIIDFTETPGWLYGFLIGFGALFGDSVKSFFKRRVGVQPGKPFFPWDQLDTYFGVLLFLAFVTSIPWQVALIGVIIVPLAHVGLNLAGYYLGLKDNKF